MRPWPILLAALWLAGCANPSGVVDRSKLSQLSVGQTTAAALAASWGPPLRASSVPDGRQVMVYRYTWLETGPLTFLPGLGPLGSSTEVRTGEVTLTFDRQGILQSSAHSR